MTYDTQLRLILVAMVLGQLFALALTVVVMLRKAPPLTTQVDQRTGVKDHGIGKWLLVLSTVFVGPAFILLIVATVREAASRVPGWVLPMVVAVGLLIIVAIWAVRVRRRGYAQGGEIPPQPFLDQVPAVLPPQPVGWSLPSDVGQWDRREVEHG